MLRHEYIEVLPSQRISWDLPDYLKYKARGSFFTMIRADIEFLVTSGVITDTTVIAQGEEFARYMLEEHPYPEFTRMEDIQVANNILDVLITSLSGH
ncbi:hypothetical protein JKY72_06805 [Candidatus Gracilibacteria bacterium]|nr:hypothetical protein [Candidatus Gracilibacteria bacterium]